MTGKDGKKYRKRTLKSGIVYEVLLAGKWKSTGQQTLERAMTWTHRQRMCVGQNITISDFAKDFYKPGGALRVRLESRNKSRSTGYWLQQQSRLERYILPVFGCLSPNEITPSMIDNWLISIDLAGNTKNKLLYSLKSIMAEAVRKGLIETSPCEKIECFGENTVERRPFTEEEMGLWFPNDENHLISIWGNVMWAAYFLCLADCGHRPGEQSVLLWGDLWEIDGRAGFIVDKSMDAITQQARATTKTGYSRSSLLSARALKILKLWHKETPMPDNDALIFTFDGKRGLIANTVNKHLRLAAMRAGIDLQGRTTYCFRHTFNTLGLLRHNPADLRFLMGHRTEKETDHYNHPDRQLLIQKALKIREDI